MIKRVTVTEDELSGWQERLLNLGQEKARLQLINHMMNRLAGIPGLENTVDALLQTAIDNLGGTNHIFYYCVQDNIYYADVYGKREQVRVITDALVKETFETREICTDEHSDIDTRMMFVMPAETVPAISLAFPLTVGPELIGVFKMEGLVSGMRVFLTQVLQPFLNYAALVLKNEISSYTRLKAAYDQLALETEERRLVAVELQKSKEELESRVRLRTEELRKLNEELEQIVDARTDELKAAHKETTAQNEELIAQNEEITVINEEMAAMNEEMTAMNEEMAAMNQEITVLNQNLAAMNEVLEQRVVERTSDLTAAHQEIFSQYQSQRRSAEIQTSLREITEAMNLATSPHELYAIVYQLLNSLLPNRSLNIALVDEEKAEIVVPYFVAESDVLPRRRPMGKGLTEYVIRQDRTVSLSESDIERLYQTGEVELRFGKLNHWIGLPLKDSSGKVIGVMSIFSIKDESILYDEVIDETKKILRIVATQLSMALERRQALEAMSESEARYRSVLEQAPDAVVLIDTRTGNVIEANARFSERFGYEAAIHGTLNLFDLIVDAPDTVRSNIDKILQLGILPVERRLIKHRNGSIISVERSAALISYRGQSLSVMTLRDVSDEVRREQEIVRDAQLAMRVQMTLLSKPAPSDYFETTTIYEPFGYVGGDLYFLDWRYDNSLLRGFLVDATGRGLGTALHTASLHVLLREVNERDLPLADAMNWLNRRAGQYFDEGTFAGALGFEIDLQTRQLRWTCAGIPNIWVATQTQQGIVQCPGMSLGILENETFDTHTMSIVVGDCFYFMTDGLSDPLGLRTDLPLDRYPEMVGLLRTLSKSTDRRDDATAVCVHVRSLPQSLVRQDGWPRILRFNGYGDYNRFKGEVTKILAEVTGQPHSFHEVAVNEALANAMECRDGVPRQHKARISFNKVENRLIVRVKTTRLGFAGNAILRRLRSHPEEMFSFGEDASMGRGIPIMLSMSHKMIYNSEGTEVLLAWKL